MYCFDNESFRFLATIKEDMPFTRREEQIYAESWEKSVEESLKLLKYLVKCSPHKVKDTISLNNSKNIVTLLSKPLAVIEQLIQENIRLIEEKQKEIENSSQTINELKNRLYIQQIDIEPVKLGYPRTVCTSSKCVILLEVEHTNIKKIDYVKHCCSNCHLRFAKCNVVNNRVLRFCSAIKLKSGICKFCGCRWSEHMHITYENQKKTKVIKNEDIELQISKKVSGQDTKVAIINKYQERVIQLQEEQKTINEINLKFAQFIRQNAITAFNDTYADYLDLFIKEENIKKSANPSNYDDKIIQGLEATRDNYSKQIEVIKQAIVSNDPSKPPVSPKEIAELEQQLYVLEINGPTLKKMKDEAERSQDNAFRYRENYFVPDWKSRIARILDHGW